MIIPLKKDLNLYEKSRISLHICGIISFACMRTASEFKRKLRESIGERKGFMQGRLTDANMIIRAIEQRRETLLKISASLLEHQKEWFDDAAGDCSEFACDESGGVAWVPSGAG